MQAARASHLVLGHHAGSQPVRGVVHQGNGFVIAGHRHHTEDRAERLVLQTVQRVTTGHHTNNKSEQTRTYHHDTHVVLAVGENSGREEAAVASRVLAWRASVQQAGALACRVCDLRGEEGWGVVLSHRANRGCGIHRVAQLVRFHLLHEPLDKVRVQRLVNVHALDATA